MLLYIKGHGSINNAEYQQLENISKKVRLPVIYRNW